MNIIVGVADLKVSNDPLATIVTYSLGSCIGISIYDPVAKVGGLLHYMLPDSSIDKVKAKNNPSMFADTGIPRLFKTAYELYAKKQRMKVVIVGGGQVLDQKGFFNIGKRNFMELKKIFWKNNVISDFEDVGGNANRTVRLQISTGQTFIKNSVTGEKIV